MAYNKKTAESSRFTHTAELTTGQLVLAVCTFLVVLLGVFLLGIIVGEYQYKLRADQAVAKAAARDATADADSGEGHQPNAYPEIRPTNAEANPAKAEPEAFRSRSAPAPESVVLPAPSPVQKPPAAQGSVPTLAEEAPPKPTQAPAAIALAPLEVMDEAPEPDADSANADEANELSSVAAGTQGAAPAADQAGSGKRVFSVQVAALSEMRNAEALKARIQQLTSLPVDIQRSENNRLYVVLVGRFENDAQAEQARNELRKQKEFAKAFVNARIL